jgi:hypothetical protein
MQAVELKDVKEGTLETALVHFDFYTLDRPTGGYRILSELLDNADCVTILTLHTGSESLVERNRKRMRKAAGKLLTSLLRNPKSLPQNIHLFRWVLKRHGFYRNRSAVAAMYQKWAEFIGNFDVTHYWLESGDATTSATDAASVALTDEGRQARTIRPRRLQFPHACHARTHFGG